MSASPTLSERAERVEAALAEVDAIFAAGSVRLLWDLIPGGRSVRLRSSSSFRRRLPTAGCRAAAGTCTIIVSGTRTFPDGGSLWSRQIARAVSGEWDEQELPVVDEGVFARALGRVLAHELGHLFLSLNGHHEDGLMRKSFSHRTLVAPTNRGFRLATRDLAAIRVAVATLGGEPRERPADSSSP